MFSVSLSATGYYWNKLYFWKCATTQFYFQAALVMFELAWVMSKDTKDMLWWGSYFILPIISHSRKNKRKQFGVEFGLKKQLVNFADQKNDN